MHFECMFIIGNVSYGLNYMVHELNYVAELGAIGHLVHSLIKGLHPVSLSQRPSNFFQKKE